MGLISTLGAYDFGYLSAGRLLYRTEKTLSAMEKLERYRGHFYNWYDTRTLEPLHPLYVSTVDSGNLAGHLTTLAEGLRELSGAPLLPRAWLKGLEDTARIFLEELSLRAAGPDSVIVPDSVRHNILRQLDLLGRERLQRRVTISAETTEVIDRLADSVLEAVRGAVTSSPEAHRKS